MEQQTEEVKLDMPRCGNCQHLKAVHNAGHGRCFQAEQRSGSIKYCKCGKWQGEKIRK